MEWYVTGQAGLKFYNLYMFQQVVLITKTALAQSTILAMDASLVTVPPLYQLNGKTVPPGESQVMEWQRLGILMKQRTPNTAAEP